MPKRAVPAVLGFALLAAILLVRLATSRSGERASTSHAPTPDTTPSVSSPPKIVEAKSPDAAMNADRKAPNTPPSPQATFASLIEHHRMVRKKFAGIPEAGRDGLSWSHAYGLIAARLLAITHPDETEACAVAILSDPQAGEDDVLFSIKTLEVLATEGRKAAENALAQAAQSRKWTTAHAALEALASCDKQGVHRGLYLNQLVNGTMEIAQLGPHWADAQTKSILQQLLNESTQPGKRKVGNFISEALARVTILEAGDRDGQLEQLIAYRRGTDWPVKAVHRQVWALRVVQMSPTPKTLEVLRERLDVAEVEAMGVLEKDTDKKPRAAHPGYVHATGDDYYDQALLAYWRLGGKLNQVETQRLTHYGYLGDPRQKLQEILTAKE